MVRNQFTFYRSFYDAVKELKKTDRSAVLFAICAYALDEEEPALSGVPKAIFELARPTLDASRRKAENGQKRYRAESGFAEDGAGSKAETKPEQSACKKESELKKEIKTEIKTEYETENETENEYIYAASPADRVFSEFWAAYPRKVGKGEARKAFEGLSETVYPALLPALEAQKSSALWLKEDGRYIPNPATWLRQGRWEDELSPSAPAASRGIDLSGLERLTAELGM